MILEDEELFLRLSSENNVSVLGMKESGRSIGSTGLESESKLLIGLLCSGAESQSSVAETFDLAPSTVSKIARGLSGDNETVDAELSKKLKERPKSKIETAHELALDSLVGTLEVLKPKVKDVVKPRELSKIAGDLSRVAVALSGSGSSSPFGGFGINGNGNKVQVIVHSPTMKKEEDFETVVVKSGI